MSRKTFVAGWSNFEGCNVTLSDLMARDTACERLQSAGYSYDVALTPPFTDGVDWRSVNLNTDSDVVFVWGSLPLSMSFD
ncbi:hypothetical protein [Myxosarcina sp. GI1(2024)]